MNMKLIGRAHRVAVIALAVLLAAPASANEPLRVELTAWKVVTESDGTERFVPGTHAQPGDVIEYRAVYTNVTERAIGQLAPTLPIPEPTEYVPASGVPAALQASLDGQTYDTPPLQRRVTGADGRTRWVEVPASEYRFLRWSAGDLAPEQSFEIRARVRVPGTDVSASAN